MRCTLSFIVAWFFACGPACDASDFHVYYLGGQSNMDGYGYTNKLPEGLTESIGGVFIFHGNTSADNAAIDGRGIWAPLRPGHGVGFKSDGKTNSYSARFGVELTLAAELRRQHPERRIALIKYSRGGTSIAQAAAGRFGCWEPDFRGTNGVNQYDHFLATIRHAFTDRDIDNDGETDRLIPAGVVWMQGESDAAYTAEIAQRYEANLKRLMDLIRAALRHDDLPVVIGRISSAKKEPRTWTHGLIVREAQAAFAGKDERAALVTSTDAYGYSDPWHYDSAGYIDLGQQFAKALVKLESSAPRP